MPGVFDRAGSVDNSR